MTARTARNLSHLLPLVSFYYDLSGQVLSLFLQFFHITCISAVSATTKLGHRLSITLLYVLWKLSQGCWLPALCQPANIFSASRMSQQYRNNLGKHSGVSLLLSVTPSQLSGTCLSGFERGHIAPPSTAMCSFCARFQNDCGISFSRGTTTDDVSQ